MLDPHNAACMAAKEGVWKILSAKKLSAALEVIFAPNFREAKTLKTCSHNIGVKIVKMPYFEIHSKTCEDKAIRHYFHVMYNPL